jgi:phytoene dehydrogenase-like protein
MLRNAREHGVAVHEGVRVHDVLFEGDRAVGVRIKEGETAFRDIRAKVVVSSSMPAVRTV